MEALPWDTRAAGPGLAWHVMFYVPIPTQGMEEDDVVPTSTRDMEDDDV
jgi:hypothetical protein